MPNTRNPNIRRSRRLSRLPPRSDAGNADCWEDIELVLARTGAPALHSPDPLLSPPATSNQSIVSDPLQSPTIFQSPLQCSVSVQGTHSRKRLQGHVPRPPNAFMCFRSDLWAKEKHKDNVERDHRMISRIAGYHWNQLSEEDRGPYKRQAEAAKRRHAEIYPEYRYAPVYRKEKPTVAKRRGSSSTGGDRKRLKTEADIVSPALNSVVRAPEHVAHGIKEELVDATLHVPAPILAVRAKRPTQRRKSRNAPIKHAPIALPLLSDSPPHGTIHTPVLTRATSEPLAQHDYTIIPDEDFVPTDEVPPLDLNDTVKMPAQEPTGIPAAYGAGSSRDGLLMRPGFYTQCTEFSGSPTLAALSESSDLFDRYRSTLNFDPFWPDYPHFPSNSRPGSPAFNDPWREPNLEEDEFGRRHAMFRAHTQISPLDTSFDNVVVDISEWIHDEDETDAATLR